MATATTYPAPASKPALPWPALLTLGGTTLVMVTAEMLPTAVLVPMSRGLGVTEALTGHLVAAWALTVVVASLPLMHLTRRIDRRTLILAGLVALAASSLVTAVAPSYAVALAARLVGAAAVGLLWASANAHVAELVDEKNLGRAIAVVLGGATLGMVLGTPLARLIADHSSWRIAFAVLAFAVLTAGLLVRALVPSRPRGTIASVGGTGSARGSIVPTLVVVILVGLLLVGHYGAYTFITRLGERAAGVLPGEMSSLLLGFGLASAAGVVLAGRLANRTTIGLIAVSAATALMLLALTWAEAPAVGLVTILALGLASGAVPPLAQTEILRLAGTGHRDLAATLIPVVFNGGIAIGAAAASVLVGRAGPTALPIPAAAVAAIAALGLAIAAARRRPLAEASREASP